MAEEGKEWLATLEPEVAAHPGIAGFKGPGDLAKSWIEAQKLVGMDKLPIPKDPKDPAWQTVYTRLGRPETPDKYQFPELKDLPQGFSVEPEEIKAFQTKAHELGITQSQASALFEHYVTNRAGLYKTTVGQLEEKRVEAEKALRAEWGGSYEANKALANKALNLALGDKAQELVDKYGNDPIVVRAFAKLGNHLSEDLLGAGSPKPGDMTPEAAKLQIAQIMGDMKHPFYIADHPEHKAAVDKVQDLHKMAYPEPAA